MHLLSSCTKRLDFQSSIVIKMKSVCQDDRSCILAKVCIDKVQVDAGYLTDSLVN